MESTKRSSTTTTDHQPAKRAKSTVEVRRRRPKPSMVLPYLAQHPGIRSVYQETPMSPFIHLPATHNQPASSVHVRSQIILGVQCLFLEEHQWRTLEIPTHKVCLKPNQHLCLFHLSRYLRSRYAATVDSIFTSINPNLPKYNPFVDNKTIELRFECTTAFEQYQTNEIVHPLPTPYKVFSARVDVCIRGIRQMYASDDAQFIPNMIVRKVTVMPDWKKNPGHEADLFVDCESPKKNDDTDSIPSLVELDDDDLSSCISPMASPLAAATPDLASSSSSVSLSSPLAAATPDAFPLLSSPLAMATPDVTSSVSSLPSLVPLEDDNVTPIDLLHVELSPASSSSLHHEMNDATAHLWQSSGKWRQYYAFKDCFICPACKSMEKDALTFERQHKYAPPFRDQSKKQLYTER